MGQYQFNRYQDALLSFEAAQSKLGLSNSLPRRYRGYDFKETYVDGDGLHLLLFHSETGIKKYERDSPNDLIGNFGVVLTNQGVVIQDDTEVDLIIPTSGGSGGRLDIVYLQHIYQHSFGSNLAIYGIKAGAVSATPIFPTLDNPKSQVVIGYIVGAVSSGVYSFETYKPISDYYHYGYGGGNYHNIINALLGLPFGLNSEQDISTNFAKLLTTMELDNEGLIGYPAKNPSLGSPNYLQNYKSVWSNLVNLDNQLKNLNDLIGTGTSQWYDIKAHATIPSTYLSAIGVYQVRRNGSNLEFMITFEKKNVTISQGFVVSIEFNQDVAVLEAILASLGVDKSSGGSIQPIYANTIIASEAGAPFWNSDRPLSKAMMAIKYNTGVGSNLIIDIHDLSGLSTSVIVLGGLIITPTNPIPPYGYD